MMQVKNAERIARTCIRHPRGENIPMKALKNLGAVLEAAGVGYEDVVRTMVFLDNMDDFATVNAIYAEYFKESAPARSCVEVARLPKGGLIEIEAIAAK